MGEAMLHLQGCIDDRQIRGEEYRLKIAHERQVQTLRRLGVEGQVVVKNGQTFLERTSELIDDGLILF
jgi:hypothetical protein